MKQPEFLKQNLDWFRGFEMVKDHDQLRMYSLDYYRIITTVDFGLGRILELLKDAEVADNTVIIFSSDNGSMLGDHGFLEKWLMLEESIHVPTIVYDPRLPEPNGRQGNRCDAMVLNIDFGPTMLEMGGVPIPDEMQGRSIVPLLADPETAWRNEWFYEHVFDAWGRIVPSEGVRSRRWKYIRYFKLDPLYESLFDLEDDPYETRDLARENQYRPVLEEYGQKWAAYQQSLV